MMEERPARAGLSASERFTSAVTFLREDYVAFVDESGDDHLQVVSGVFIPARWMRPAHTYLDDVRATEGLRQPDELKAAELATGRGFAWQRAETLYRAPGLSKKVTRDRPAATSTRACSDTSRD